MPGPSPCGPLLRACRGGPAATRMRPSVVAIAQRFPMAVGACAGLLAGIASVIVLAKGRVSTIALGSTATAIVVAAGVELLCSVRALSSELPQAPPRELS